MDEDELWKKYKNEHNLNVDESAEHFHQWRKVFLMMMDLANGTVENGSTTECHPQHHWDCLIVCSKDTVDMEAAHNFQKLLQDRGYIACLLHDVPAGTSLMQMAETMLEGSPVVFVMCTTALLQEKGVAKMVYQDQLMRKLVLAEKHGKRIVPIIFPLQNEMAADEPFPLVGNNDSLQEIVSLPISSNTSFDSCNSSEQSLADANSVKEERESQINSESAASCSSSLSIISTSPNSRSSTYWKTLPGNRVHKLKLKQGKLQNQPELVHYQVIQDVDRSCKSDRDKRYPSQEQNIQQEHLQKNNKEQSGNVFVKQNSIMKISSSSLAIPFALTVFEAIYHDEPDEFMRKVSSCFNDDVLKNVRRCRDMESEKQKLLLDTARRRAASRAAVDAVELFYSCSDPRSLQQFERCLRYSGAVMTTQSRDPSANFQNHEEYMSNRGINTAVQEPLRTNIAEREITENNHGCPLANGTQPIDMHPPLHQTVNVTDCTKTMVGPSFHFYST